MPELHPLLADRWSPRGFDGMHEVGHAELASLMEAARWAPSAGNGQPWRFAIGRRDDETHKRIFESLDGDDQRWAWRASALIAAGFVDTPTADTSTADGPTADGPVGGPTAGGPAPVIPAARRPEAGDGNPGAAGAGSADARAVGAAYDLGQAVAHLGVQALALDLHTHQMVRFDAVRLRRELELPDALTVHAVVAVGRLGDPVVLPPDLREREFKLRERRPIEELLLA